MKMKIGELLITTLMMFFFVLMALAAIIIGLMYLIRDVIIPFFK